MHILYPKSHSLGCKTMTFVTLYPNIKFDVNLDGKIWYYVKRPNYPSSQSIKKKWKITHHYPKLYSLLHFAP